MLASAPAGQLRLWRAHFERRPFGSNWHMHSMVAAQIINAIREIEAGLAQRKLKEDEYLKSDVFVPQFGPPKRAATPNRITGRAALRAAFKMMARV